MWAPGCLVLSSCLICCSAFPKMGWRSVNLCHCCLIAFVTTECRIIFLSLYSRLCERDSWHFGHLHEQLHLRLKKKTQTNTKKLEGNEPKHSLFRLQHTEGLEHFKLDQMDDALWNTDTERGGNFKATRSQSSRCQTVHSVRRTACLFSLRWSTILRPRGLRLDL